MAPTLISYRMVEIVAFSNNLFRLLSMRHNDDSNNNKTNTCFGIWCATPPDGKLQISLRITTKYLGSRKLEEMLFCWNPMPSAYAELLI